MKIQQETEGKLHSFVVLDLLDPLASKFFHSAFITITVMALYLEIRTGYFIISIVVLLKEIKITTYRP